MLVAEDEAGALQEDRGNLVSTNTVENRESSLYLALVSTRKEDES